MFERTSDDGIVSIYVKQHTTYVILVTISVTISVKKHSTCYSGVMPPTLHTCDETTHVSLWCDDTHTTTIPVKKQSTCHSGVMPPTLHTCEETTHMSLWCDANHTTTYLWRNNPHVTSSGVTPPTLQQYLWRNIPQVTQVWCSWFWVSTAQKDLLLCVFTLLQSRRHRHNIFCVINPHNTSERRIYIFVMFRALNVTLTETFIKAWRLQGDINSQNTTTWEGTIHMLLMWCSVRYTIAQLEI